MSRDIGDVIDRIIQVLPEEANPVVAAELKKIKSDAGFAAPETMGGVWNKAAQVLTIYIGIPKEDWQIKVSKIFSGTE